MHHYTYLITFPDGMQYVGMHTSQNEPHLDVCYLGSGSHLPTDRNWKSCTKEILGVYNTREEAFQAEAEYIQKFDCIASDAYYNCRVRTFDKYGQRKHTDENIAAMAHKLRGRTKDTHKYMQAMATKHSWYAGENRTPAQKLGDAIRREKNKGANPAKGHHKTDNQGFVPWYYTNELGVTTNVYDVTKQDYAERLGITKRQIAYYTSSVYAGIPIKRGPLKGWIFGNL